MQVNAMKFQALLYRSNPELKSGCTGPEGNKISEPKSESEPRVVMNNDAIFYVHNTKMPTMCRQVAG